MACDRPDEASADLLESAAKVYQVGICLFGNRRNPVEHVQSGSGHVPGLIRLVLSEYLLDLSGQTGERFLVGIRQEVAQKAWRVVGPSAELSQRGHYRPSGSGLVEQTHDLVPPRHHPRPGGFGVKARAQTMF